MTIEEENIRTDLYNMDETGFAIGFIKSSHVVVKVCVVSIYLSEAPAKVRLGLRGQITSLRSRMESLTQRIGVCIDLKST